MRKNLVALFCLPGILLLLAFLTGCPPDGGSFEGLMVAVSIPPQAYLAERIGGAHLQVTTLLQPGESPATYQPSDHQVSQILQSRIFFQIGVPFERGKWAGAVSSSVHGISIVDTRKGVPLRRMKDHHHDTHESGEENDHAEGADPHIWLAPALLKIQARTMADNLIKADPEHAAAYRANLEVLLSDLDRLHDELQKRLSPYRGRSLFLYHPAWGYFCDAYGLEQVALEIEGKEPSDEELTRLQVRIRASGTRVIFVQPQIAGTSARAVAEALGVELRTIDPLARDILTNLRSVGETIAAHYH